MPDQSGTDIVMRFTYGDKVSPDNPPATGDPVLAECALAVDSKDKFMEGFEAADYDTYSNFFEVLNFSFNFRANEQSSKDENVMFQAGSSFNKGQAGGVGGMLPDKDKDKDKVPGLSGEFAKWRSIKDPEWEDQKFGIDIESFSFSRLIDRASPTFFTWCSNSYTFQKAALVKRISVGLGPGGNSIPQGYLRFDFTNIMLTGVKWNDGDVVTEECEIVFEKFEVK